MNLPESDRAGLVADVLPGDNSPPLTVGELSGALKRTVESAFDTVRVRGEVSGFKRHGSGHCYFTLKDDVACIDAVIWRGNASALAFRPEDGAEVIATGRLTTYPGRSKYQIVIERMELAGEGALMALLERRRRALAEQGLFDPKRKRRLPFMPRVIAVVTSPTGAVIRDILHRLEHRCPTRVVVWPVPVQGEGAAAKVAAAIRGFAALDGTGAIPRPDLLIVARGGGSIEDLWAFNEEEVVRAAADCSIPLISAVGHETDTTLIDHAADVRAPTPTAAAEMAVPVRAELLTQLADLEHRGRSCLIRQVERGRERYQLTACRWPRPEELYAPVSQKFDDLGDRLPRALDARAGRSGAELAGVAPRLRPQLLLDRVSHGREKLAALWKMIELVHPDRPLRRGFARVTSADGRLLATAGAARSEARLQLHFVDGVVEASPGSETVRKAVERPRRTPYPPPQPGLFDSAEE